MLTASLTVTVFKRNKKRALSIVAECPSGRSGTLRTACEGKSPAESGTAVSTSGTSSDAETRNPVLTKRGAGSPERGRAGQFTQDGIDQLRFINDLKTIRTGGGIL